MKILEVKAFMSSERYDIDVRNSLRETAKLLYVTTAKYGGDWHSVQHTHNCSELFYVIEGNGQFLIENKTYPVSGNDLVIINPNVLHTELSLNASPLRYIVLGVEGLELKDNSSEYENSNFRIINLNNIKDNILLYLQNMLHEMEAQSPGHEIICQIVLLGRQTNFSTTFTPVNKKTSRLCGSTKRYIDNHYKETITLEVLAEQNHVSKYYLVHAFTQEFGISPINYLISRRIREAEHLLANTDLSLSTISSTAGFSSASYFAQIFKRQKGVTPREYRKESKKEQKSFLP